MSLSLSKVQIEQVRACWSNIEANNRYHKDDFTSRLFSNLLISNPSLKSLLSNDIIIREQAALLGDLFNYAVLYLGNVRRLDNFLAEFFSENAGLVSIGPEYLEPLGSSLMQTFRQWLGKGKFDEEQEAIWVQIYIHIANRWLQFCGSVASDEDDAEEVASLSDELVETEAKKVDSSETESEDHEGPKQVIIEEQKERPIDPTRNIPILDSGASLKINLTSNEKYRGFRRSVNENTTEVSVKIPRNNTFERQKSSLAGTGMSYKLMSKLDKVDFDPRLSKKLSKTSTASIRSVQSSEADGKSSTFEIKSYSTSRSSSPEYESAISLGEKFGNKKPKMVYDSDDEMENEAKAFGFDPRKKRSAKYSSEEEECESDDSDNVKPLFSKPQHTRVDSAFSENFVSDVEDTLDLISKSDSPELKVEKQEVEEYKQRISHFDANSFGIKGLAPIVETALDDTSSSIYNSENNTSSENISMGRSVEETTSAVSTLSLHNSHYSDGTDIPTSPTNQPKREVRQASQTSEFSYIKPLGAGTRLKTSLSLCSLPLDSSAPRASLGFMRSSFILKKEMDDLGFNIPENVASPKTEAKPTMETPSLKLDDENLSSTENFAAYAYVDSFMPITNGHFDRKMTASCSNLGMSRSSSSQPNLHAVKPQKARRQARNNKYDPMEATLTTASIRRSNFETGHIKVRRSFRDKMKSFFSSTPKSAKTISSPLETTYSTNSAIKARRTSISTSRSGVSKVPSLVAPPSLSTTTRANTRRQSSVSDMRSITTFGSNDSTSGFSFFSKGKQSTHSRYTTRGDRTKMDKYRVTAVPYNVFAR